MLKPDSAEAQREADQIWEAQLCAGEVVPARVGVFGRDAVGIDVDARDFIERDLFVPAQPHQRLDGGLEVAAACIGLDVTVCGAERDDRWQRDRPHLVAAPERESLHEAIARFYRIGRSLYALRCQQRRLQS